MFHSVCMGVFSVLYLSTLPVSGWIHDTLYEI